METKRQEKLTENMDISEKQPNNVTIHQSITQFIVVVKYLRSSLTYETEEVLKFSNYII